MLTTFMFFSLVVSVKHWKRNRFFWRLVVVDSISVYDLEWIFLSEPFLT